MKRSKALASIISAVLLLSGCSATSSVNYVEIESSDDTVLQNTNFDALEDREEESVQAEIESIYNANYSQLAKDNLDSLKEENEYTQENPLIVHNPFGTNTLSLYVYFKSDKKFTTSYTIHADGYTDYSQTIESTKTKEHEFQIIGLIPDVDNEITLTYSDGSTYTFTYNPGSLLGQEEMQLEQTSTIQTESLTNGLYTILGNDSDELDFMYYYDNTGTIRGEIPIRGYRSHRILFNKDLMYYSISQYKIAVVDNLGQVKQIISTGDYELHHDYVFDEDGNILVLASKLVEDDYENSRSEDLIIKINTESGEITDELDLGDIFSDYKENFATRPEDDENSEGVYGMDWIHINTIQYAGDDSIILSSRETSTIIKLSNPFDEDVSIDYLIGEEGFWKDTEYADKVLTKVGDFSTATGQHSVTFEKDDSLEDGQYYLYLFNNNFGSSATNTEYDWSQIEGTNLIGNYAMSKEQLQNAHSYYYKYLVDENAGTYSLVQSFEVPFSAYVSSAQDIDGNIVIDSGFQGLFGEYSSDGTLLAQFKMKKSKYMIYRVYKYSFDGFYFNK